MNLTVNPTSTSTTNLSICPSELPYVWNGLTFTASGTQTAHLTNLAGCDSAATLNLTVNPTSTSTTNLSICPSELPYTWNSLVFTGSGTQTAHLKNSVECDSAATLNLTVKPTSTSTTNISICPSELPYVWNGLTFTASGTQTAHLTNLAGCDSAATLNLTVNPTSTSTTNISICPSELPYTWNSLVFTGSGTQTAHLKNSVECDSAATLNLTVKPTSTSTTNISICPSELPYTWNSLVFIGSGTQTAHLKNSVECDSAATLNLTVKATSTSTTNLSICPSELPYVWNGLTFTASGTQTAHLKNSVECDSAATLNLTVNPTSTSTTNTGICPSELPYVWNSLTFTASGTQTAHLTNLAGCDSAATLNLTVNPTSTSTTNISICPSELPYTWNSLVFTASGTQTAHLKNSVECDSAASLNLTVNPTSTSTTNISICPSELPYTWNSLVFTGSGTQIAHLKNSVECDSAATLNLTVNPTSTSTTNISICPSELPFVWNGLTFTTSGTQTAHLTNLAGCDSAATLNLTVKATSTSTTNTRICPSELPYTWNSLVFTGSGTKTAHLKNSVECDSAATLNLTVNPTSTSTTNISICPSELPYTWNSLVFTGSGTKTAHLKNSVECDSAATLNLTVNPTSTSTTNISICPSELPYVWNGLTFTASGTQKVHLKTKYGCDSIATLNLKVNSSTISNTYINICSSSLPYFWNGKTYNAAGSYNVKLINAAGCDSITTLVLKIKSPTVSTTNMTVCSTSLPFIWNGKTYTVAGSYSVKLVNAAGCDSIATLVLKINNPTVSTTNMIVCSSSLPYRWNGKAYAEEGSFNTTLNSVSGCDSIATLVLKIMRPTVSTTNITICSSSLPYSWNGKTLTAAGTYSARLNNSVGCDSIATLVLKLNSAEVSTTIMNVCHSDLPISWNKNKFYNAGTYEVNLIGANGCDSIATLVLNEKSMTPPNLGNERNLCPGDSLILNPGTYVQYLWQDNSTMPDFTVTQTGDYSVNVIDKNGCVADASVRINILPNCGDIFFPTAFTPNGDGLNDTFGALGELQGISDYTLYIYNRWGELVFTTHNPYEKWNGVYKGQITANVNYVWYSKYVLNGSKNRIQKGNLMLIK